MIHQRNNAYETMRPRVDETTMRPRAASLSVTPAPLPIKENVYKSPEYHDRYVNSSSNRPIGLTISSPFKTPMNPTPRSLSLNVNNERMYSKRAG